MGICKHIFAESGVDSFYGGSTRNRTPWGSTHRWQIRKLTIDEIRRQTKLSIEANPDYAPPVDANQFVTIAKEYYGLDPPD